MMSANITRFEIPAEIMNLLSVAKSHQLIDDASILALGITHGDNWQELVNEICDWAFAARHSPNETHRDVVRAAEKYWAASRA